MKTDQYGIVTVPKSKASSMTSTKGVITKPVSKSAPQNTSVKGIVSK